MKRTYLAVNGSLMRGFDLNKNLLDAKAEFTRNSTTSPNYRLWSINDSYPAMLRDEVKGSSIDLEIWELSIEGLMEILEKEPPGLCLGNIELEDGTMVLGILGEFFLIGQGTEITDWGGWRNYKLGGKE